MKCYFFASLALLAMSSIGVGQGVLPSNGQGTNAAPPATQGAAAPSEQIVNTFRDQITGREMEVVQITRTVPELRMGTKEVKETRVVPEWTSEVKQSTQYYQVPQTQMQLQPRWIGRFNPFVEPRLVYDSVPVTTYRTVPATVNVPVQYPKWVTKEFTVRVPEPEQTTRVIREIVTRPKGSGAGNMSSATPLAFERGNQFQSAAQIAQNNRTAPIEGRYPLQDSPVRYPSTAPVTVNPNIYSNGLAAMPLGAYSKPALINPSGWRPASPIAPASNVGNGPLFANNVFSSNTNRSGFTTASYPGAGYTTNRYASTSSGSSLLPMPSGTPAMMPSQMAPTSVFPQTASLPGSGTFRDPIQAGIRPTELR